MKTVAAAVRNIIQQDPIAYEALGRDLLNTHAYAREVHGSVEESCMKPVKVNTIVTALTRLRKECADTASLVPKFEMDSMTVRLDIVEAAFQKGVVSRAAVEWLKKQKRKSNDFFLTVDGNLETDCIFPKRFLPGLQEKFGDSDAFSGFLEDLIVITLSYASDLTHQPNIGYTLMRGLALKHINVVEVVSTYSEVHFVLWATDMQEAMGALSPFLKNRDNAAE